jgi:DNA mismatch repair protein MutS2
MDERTLRVLEFDKIRERLARFASFSVGVERVQALLPTDDIRLAQEWLAELREARRLLDQKSDIYLGGVHDLRPFVAQALRGSPLLPTDFVDVRYTLVRARALQRSLARLADQFPHVADVALRISAPQTVIEAIGRCIDERGDVLDSASEDLARIRRELRESHSRLMERLQRIVANPTNSPYLQEALITQRQGRYVIPLRAEFKGRIPGLVHDQSGSGATLFIEPLAVVDLNNRWREAQLAEEEEIRRILVRLTELIAVNADAIINTVEALGDLDLIFAKARYANELRGVEPELAPWKSQKQGTGGRGQGTGGRGQGSGASFQPPASNLQHPTSNIQHPASNLQHPGSTIRLLQARHPLLDPLTVVPIDLYLDDDYFVIVVTGPNTGGKTVSLKTTGLLTLMAQAGLAIPAAEGSTLSVFEQVFADIGDEQSIEQSLSTFSSHMTHIVDILERADDRSLVLLDELGAGTDPEEGAALAQALLSTLLERRITALATTHYSELKVYAHTTPFVTNASVEFDIETLSPTYRLSIGLPGRSNAFAIARRLGLVSAIVARAEALVSPHAREADAMLAEIKAAREAALAAEAEAKAAQRRGEALTADLRYRLAKVEEERRAVLSETRALAQAELDAVQQEVAQVRERLAGVSSETPRGQSLHAAWLAEAEMVLAQRAAQTRPLPAIEPPQPIIIEGPLAAGDKVWIPSLQGMGEVVVVGDRELEVKVGAFRMKLAPHRVELRQRGEQPALQTSVAAPRPASPGMELDLRGLTVDDMLMELDRYLDTAYLAGLPHVRIIHGKGTGALRVAVRDELRRHPLIKEFRSGESNEGGEGVTVAKLVQR